MALVYFCGPSAVSKFFFPDSWTSLPNGPFPFLPKLKKPFFSWTRKLQQVHLLATLQVPTLKSFLQLSLLCFALGLPSTHCSEASLVHSLFSGSQTVAMNKSPGSRSASPILQGILRRCCACKPLPLPTPTPQESAPPGSALTSPEAPQPGPLVAGLMGEPERGGRSDCCP